MGKKYKPHGYKKRINDSGCFSVILFFIVIGIIANIIS